MQRILLYALACASGAVGISYEVLFFRRLALVFGVAEWAAALVVGLFLTGLGLGAWLSTRWREPARPLRFYALAELGLALLGWLCPLAIPMLGAAAWLVILPPAMLMGASFPLLAAAAVRLEGSAAKAGARVYGWNTLGAAAGVLLCAFASLPALGLDGTTRLAILGNLLLAGGAAGLQRRQLTAPPAEQHRAASTVPIRLLPGWLLWAAALIGAVSLALQVLANRLLGSLLAGTVYTFASILFVFLAGIGLGAWVGARWVHGRSAPRAALGWLAACAPPALLLSLLALQWRCGGEDLFAGVIQIGLYEPTQPIDALPPSAWFALCVEYSAILLALPTLLLGAFLPACAAYISRERAAGSLGLLYLVNTLGALAGGLLAAHLLLEMLGLRGLFAALLTIPGLLALALVARRGLLVLPMAVAAVWTLQPGAPPGTARGLETLAYRESAASGAKVEQVRDAAEPQPVRILRVNGKPVASSILIDRRLQYMLGLITTLSHPDPRRTLCIGLGTGMSARALAAGSRELDVIELSPAVVAMQPYFSVWNGSIHERANTRIRIDDGRAFLEQRAQSYECISADPIDPCVAGSAYLYTLEYYRLGARHLTPDGVMSQWIPLYDLAQEDIASIVRTFLAVFPHAQGWVTGYDLVLVGSQRPLTLDPTHWERRLKEPEIAALATDVGILSVDDLLGSCFALREDLERLAARAPTINTDDRPWIEFHAPLANFGSYPSSVYRFLAECRTTLEFAAGTAEHRRAEIQTRRRQLMDAAWDFARDVETSRAWGEARNRYIERLRGR